MSRRGRGRDAGPRRSLETQIPVEKRLVGWSRWRDLTLRSLRGWSVARRGERRTMLSSLELYLIFLYCKGTTRKGASESVHGLIDEAAEPDIHYQADRHEHEQSGRAAVTHER